MNDSKIIDVVLSELDKLSAKLDRYNETLLRLTVTVEEHARRSDLLEKRTDKIEVTDRFIRNGLKIISVAGAVALTLHGLGIF